MAHTYSTETSDYEQVEGNSYSRITDLNITGVAFSVCASPIFVGIKKYCFK